MNNIHPNILATFNLEEKTIEVDSTAYVHPLATIIGNVNLGNKV